MSALLWMLGSVSRQLISGVLSGSGTLSIPAGVTVLSLTGRGGVGGDNSWYDPGQPYIAPSGYHAGQPYIAPSYGWTLYSQSGPSGPIAPQYEADYAWSEASPSPAPTAVGQAKTVYWLTGTPGHAYLNYKVYSSSQISAGQPYIAPYYDDPGQPYIAPSSGGGAYYGTSTTASINGVTLTWPGGFGAGVQGDESTQTAGLTGVGQTLNYACASGTTMTYFYEV